MKERHEDIGWPTPKEESALDKAAKAGARAYGAQTLDDEAELARRCNAAAAFRMTQEAIESITKPN
jgi:hypothetical protein